ncbi:MAG: rRNA maturation RNAse YbeY, partial [Planctomycetota bacterium]
MRVTRLVDAPDVDDESLREAAQRALEHGERPELPLDVILTDDPTLAELHERCLGDPTPTDVMSFDLSDDQLGPQGEVYASVDRAREVAARRGVAAAREL